ncbi:response regulator [Flavobacterium sp. UW10123]|uniref:phosphorylase family protein n=1 Tax=Flavobacterium sp. UW10123 TaxID=3230800 RepID=UPI0033937A6D
MKKQLSSIMIGILIVDDNQNKIKALRQIAEKYTGQIEIETCTNIISAKKMLSVNHFDLLILDLGIPLRDGDDPLPENGINFLDDINRGSGKLIKPFHIIGFSAFNEYIANFHSRFENELWSLIKYEENSTNWQTKIISKIDYLLKSKIDLQNSTARKYQYDLAIITALRKPELDSLLNLNANWESFKLNNDSTEYFRGNFIQNDKKISVVAASAPQMGMVAASVLTNKLINNFRPKYLAMTGIAGGVKGIGNFGDILISDISFDYGSGKIKSSSDGSEEFSPDYKSINLNADLKENLLSCQGNREFLNDIKKNWSATKIDTELNIHIGPFASGSAVLENGNALAKIKIHSRKLIGIDMEAYGVFYTCENCSKPKPLAALSIKSICDYGDSEKNDYYQTYAAYTSANFLYHFSLNRIDFEI